MLQLTFNQTNSELLVRAASSVLFGTLVRRGSKIVSISDLAERPQYGFTASAATEPVGPKFVRITDLQDGRIDWENVPFCECAEPEKHLLRDDDLLFARTGATTGKTHLVRAPEHAVFASYLIRLRPKAGVYAGYLYAFFQSENYWSQISDEKGGSAQPNVNGEKLAALQIPLVESKLQHAITEFLRCVRRRQDGEKVTLPDLPAPLAEQRRIIARIEELAAQIHEARTLRQQAAEQADAFLVSAQSTLTQAKTVYTVTVEALVGKDGLRNGKSVKSNGSESEIRCLTLSSMRNGRINTRDTKTVPMSRAEAGPFKVRGGHVYVVRGNGSKDLCGRAGVIPDEAEGVIFPDLFIQVRLPQDRILPEFFVAAWNSSATRAVIEEKAKTTSGIWKINQGHILSTQIPVPPIAEQRRIVAELDALQAQVDALKPLQAETAAELDALLPAILDKAFKGEL